MNSYGDHVLARSIANERISHREPINLTLGWHPIKQLVNAYNRMVDSISEQVSQPVLASVYCAEIAPGC